MQKIYYTIILLLNMTTISYAMDKNTQVNYYISQKLNNGVLVTKIDFFRSSEGADKSEKLVKTIYLDENQTKAFMHLAKEANEAEARRAWNAKFNVARL